MSVTLYRYTHDYKPIKSPIIFGQLPIAIFASNYVTLQLTYWFIAIASHFSEKNKKFFAPKNQ
jgi:hypothetical protein